MRVHAGEPVSKEHVRHRRGNGLENRCAVERRPECNGLRDSASFQSRSAFSIAAGAAILWCSANFMSVVQSSGLRRETQPRRLNHFSSLRSSTAEHPPDKRETVARHHAEGPFPNTGWLRQMSSGLKPRSGWRATNSSGHFKTEYSRALARQAISI